MNVLETLPPRSTTLLQTYQLERLSCQSLPTLPPKSTSFFMSKMLLTDGSDFGVPCDEDQKVLIEGTGIHVQGWVGPA